jgi:hypothetical protein
MSGTGGDGPGGLAANGNELGRVQEPADEVSAAPIAPQEAAIAPIMDAYGEGAVHMGMAAEGDGGEADRT